MPVIIALSNLYATQFMLGLGYKKQWSKIIIEGAGINFLILASLVPFIDPGKSVAITAVSVELWVLMRSAIFYRKHRNDIVQ